MKPFIVDEEMKYSIWSALESADGFRKTGLLVAPRSAHAKSKSSLDGSPLGELAVGAVNLSFALELYLKALLLHFSIKPIATHKLHKLYLEIPEDLRKHMSIVYAKALEVRIENESEFTISGFFHSSDPEHMEKKSSWADPSNPPLDTLLKAHEDAFYHWRYGVFELKTLELGYQFNFRAFATCVDVARDIAWSILKAKNGIPDREKRPNPSHWPRAFE